jgi:predicted nucleic acid-binding protein
MELVIDTSAIIAVIANEPIKPALIEATAGATLLAPASVPWEIGNAFSAMLKRGRITLDQAREALAAYEAIPIRFVQVELEAAIRLSSELGIYAYDAYLIAAAQSQRCPLLTLDGGLVHAAVKKGVPLVEVQE